MEETLVNKIFFRYALSKIEEVENSKTMFAHYTSAQNGLNIINGKSVWLRNARGMNDFSEIDHGRECIECVWKDQIVSKKIQTTLDSIHSDIRKQVEKFYEETWYQQVHETYLISLSEFGNFTQNEEDLGRLSMWRAYGGETNVALIMSKDAIIHAGADLPVYSSPVLYADKELFKKEFELVLNEVVANRDQLKRIRPEVVADTLARALFFAALSTKHPGFAEEREWRVLYSPALDNSKVLRFDVECPSGVPQKVYKLHLRNDVEEGLGLMPKDIIQKVLIGPTEHPNIISEAYRKVLEDNQFRDPASAVSVSGIPLRR